MGQYYNAVVTTNKGVTKRIERYVKDNSKTPKGQAEYVFAKLTEHSWVSNYYVEGVCRFITNKRGRIAWVGDYAEGDIKSFDGTVAPVNTDVAYHQEKSDENMIIQKTIVAGKTPLDELKYKFIVNHSRKEFVDIERYCAMSVMEDETIQHPVPLLTAIGNGNGGGDYWGVNQDYIGRWAYDEIEITNNVPSDYELFDVFFNERIADNRNAGMA